MSGIEREELADQIRATTGEEQIIIARLLNDDVLWDELKRRYMIKSHMIRDIKETVKE